MPNKNILSARCLTDKYVALMLLVFPLFTGLQGYAAITVSKYLFFSVATSLWLAAVVVLRLKAGGRLHLRLPQLFALIFAVWACVSAAMSPYAAESLIGSSRYDGLITLLLYTGIFIGVSSFGVWKPMYVYLLAISTAATFAVAGAQLMGSSVLFPNDYTYYDAGIKYVSKFLGTIGNTNLFAAFICLSVPLMGAAGAFKFRYSIILKFLLATGTFLLTVSESSGGMVALAVCGALCAPVFAKRGVLPQALVVLGYAGMGVALGLMGKRPMLALLVVAISALGVVAAWVFEKKIPIEKHTKITIILISTVAVAAILAIYFVPWNSGTVYELSQLLHGKISDEFGSSRILIWRETLKLVPERLLFGGGPDTLALRLDLSFSRYFPALEETLTTYTDNAHNVYLGYLVNLGLPGLISYLALIAVTLYRILKGAEARTVILGAALICAWAEGLFGLGLCLVAPIMWVLWGLIFAQNTSEQETSKLETDRKEADTFCVTDNDGVILRVCGDADDGARKLAIETDCNTDCTDSTDAERYTSPEPDTEPGTEGD